MLIERAVDSVSWLKVSRWACEQPLFVDYADVKHELGRVLGDAADALYVCGADHARAVRPAVSYVAVGRAGAPLPPHRPQDNRFACVIPTNIQPPRSTPLSW